MGKSGVQLVCFDLGRVLIRICDGWRHACEVAGLPAPESDLRAEDWSAMLDLVNRIEVGERGEAGIDEFCRRMGERLGVSCEHVAEVWRNWTLGPYPGAAELLGELRAAGVKTACLSNTNIRHWQILTDSGDPHFSVVGRLDHRYASHLIGARKPDEAAYAYVERETGAVCGGILFFDDLAENVEAANRRGWRARLVPRCDNPVPLIRRTLMAEGVL